MVVRLSDVSSKTGKKYIFCVFRLFLSLHRTASQQYRLSIVNWQSPENDILFSFWFLVIGLFKKFSRKFHRLVLGFVGLIDAKGIDVAQRI